MNKLITIKFKKLSPDAVIPSYAMEGDAGVDLTAISFQRKEGYIEYNTGIAIEIPLGFVGKIFARGSISKKDLILANCVGIIDSGYRGELKCRFKELPPVKKEGFMSVLSGKIEPDIYQKGDKIAQLIIEQIPIINLVEVDELSSTQRGEGRFGSTDQNKIQNE